MPAGETEIAAQEFQVFDLANEAEEMERLRGKHAARCLVAEKMPIDVMMTLLQRGSELTRRKTLSLLYYMDGEPAKVAVLDVLALDDSAVVRHEAAFYVGAMAHVNAVERLVFALRNDPADLVRHEAAEALGDMGATESRDALSEAARNDPSAVVVSTAKISLQQLSNIDELLSPAAGGPSRLE